MDRITWPERMKEHAQVYMRQIKQDLTQGLIQGEGFAKITRKIVEKTNINGNKILRIVRTEGHRIQNASRLIAFDDSEAAADRLGIKTSRVWIPTQDDRTRKQHLKMEGKKAKRIDGVLKFTFPDGVTTEGPGLSGVAEHDIHCRCTVRMGINSIT